MAAEKYRINALAKDFDVKSKDIITMLDDAGLTGRTHMAVLEDDELSIIFETITQANTVDITAFFKEYDDKKNAKKEQERKAAEEARAAAEEEKRKRKAAAAAQKPQGQKQPQPQQPQKKRSRDEVRVVDTRGTANVDLSKYDEKILKYDTAPESHTSVQKIKKKNKYNDQQKGKKQQQQAKNMQKPAFKPKPVQLKIQVPDTITVGELASRMKTAAGEVIKKLMLMGVMATVNETIDYDTAYLVADEFKIKVEREIVLTLEDRLFDETEDSEENLVLRAPVVVVMGHVDHGKTSLLDAIRHTNVTAGEAGGITQHIGAYRVDVDGKEVTFLDTPGHAAFTAMRARGANLTDVAVLVVAADDGIMPQTVEAINHAKAAGVTIIVAINKIDRPGADPDRVKTELTKYDLVPEEWGGETICVPVSALKREGIKELLDMILLSSEMLELKANPNRAAKGVVIEARLDKGKGAVATLLVQNGTLKTGDIIIAGTAVGRVRVMTDHTGKKLSEAGPSVPVEIMGLAEVPEAGDLFNAVADERLARDLAEDRRAKKKEEQQSGTKVSLDDLFSQIESGVKSLNIIVKADVQGSAEAVKASLEKLSNEEVKVSVIHAAAGGITESDVMLANASEAIIVGFNVRPDRNAIDIAARSKVEIRTYRVIYECLEEIEAALKGMLAPTFRENVLGHAEVRNAIRVPAVGTIAGSYVLDGKIARNAMVRVVRDGIVIAEDKISSLKRFKDDAREVLSSFECGIGLEKFGDIKVGDILEAYVMEEVER